MVHRTGRRSRPRRSGDRQSRGVALAPSGEAFAYHIVPDDRGLLAGVYIKFEGGKDGYKARFSAPYYKPADVVFQRGPREGRFEVERAPAP